MSKVYTRVVDDACAVTDPDDARVDPELKEYCIVSHAHFMAANLDEALRKLAAHFRAAAEAPPEGNYEQDTFHAGMVQVGLREAMHTTSKGRPTH